VGDVVRERGRVERRGEEGEEREEEKE